jgi:hypothetical protein
LKASYFTASSRKAGDIWAYFHQMTERDKRISSPGIPLADPSHSHQALATLRAASLFLVPIVHLPQQSQSQTTFLRSSNGLHPDLSGFHCQSTQDSSWAWNHTMLFAEASQIQEVRVSDLSSGSLTQCQIVHTESCSYVDSKIAENEAGGQGHSSDKHG